MILDPSIKLGINSKQKQREKHNQVTLTSCFGFAVKIVLLQIPIEF